MNTAGQVSDKVQQYEVKAMQWYDSWSEGPFTTEEVSAVVCRCPGAAQEYHAFGGRTFGEYQQAQVGSD